MYKKLTILTIALILAGAGCVSDSKNIKNTPTPTPVYIPEATDTPTPTVTVTPTPSPTETPVLAPTSTSTAEVDTSNWKTYTNKEYGFSFRYPQEFGIPTFVIMKNNIFDAGTIASISFANNSDVEVYFFSDDYSVGSGEGTSNYFNIKTDFTLNEDQLKKYINNKSTGVLIPVTYLNKIKVNNHTILKIIGYRGYVKLQPAVSYLIKNINNNSQINNLFLVYSKGDLKNLDDNDGLNKFVEINKKTILILDRFVSLMAD